LESLRIELIRVMALDITGYEAPLLKSGITESADALASLRDQLQPYLQKGNPRSDSLLFFLDKAIGSLRGHPGFDEFDRLDFLSGSALPLQHQLALFIRESGIELNTSGVLNYSADHLFSADALVIDHFPGGHTGNKDAMTRLGKILFSEKSLSGNGIKSCASCHDPGKMFTDGEVTPLAFDGHHHLERNAPSLLYSGFQYSQFWDGRVKSLEQQVRTVLCDPREMNADTMALIRWWKAQGNPTFPATRRIPSQPGTKHPASRPLTEAIQQVAVTENTDESAIAVLAASLAAYVRSLHPMNSAFDRYMRGDHQALNERERHGANLFMGKAQCATCHFIPLFNGLIPPDYTRTEFEVLGTTRSDHFQRTSLSSDPGRYKLYPFIFYKRAFKTPTVRNAAATAPYMHNGSIHSLERLVEFYNKGGGAGLGLNIDDQTLSSRPLHLSPQESRDIILFIHALTDSICIKQ
ncbi:MAG TPA: cytochrome c peroxidase, partial [Puia sp.]|nr:cytochrome c peroxidase [Puia sp.]